MIEATLHRPLGPVQLAHHAQELGKGLQVTTRHEDVTAQQYESFEAACRGIQSAYQIAADWSQEEGARSPVVDWLLDNYSVITEKIREIRLHLPKRFFHELPKLVSGHARVQVIADELLLHTDSAIDEQLILEFANGVQVHSELTIGEVWALPTLLKVGLIERLFLLCQEMVRDYEAFKATDEFLRRIETLGYYDRKELRSLNRDSSIIALHARSKTEGRLPASLRAELQDVLDARGQMITELHRVEQHRLASCQVAIGNVIASLRLLDYMDWPVTFEAINASERLLRQDPAGVYSDMDFASRNRYRDVVERLAKGSDQSESAICRLVLDLATHAYDASQGKDEVQSHVGYWLADEGAAKLERMIGYRARWVIAVQRAMRRHPNVTYFGLLAVPWLTIMAAFLMGLESVGATLGVLVLLGMLAAIPVSECAVLLANALLTRILPVDLLPKRELQQGVPENHPTFVVVPAMLSGDQAIRELLNRLESHYLANPERNVFFALLTDFSDADQPTMPSDASLLAVATSGIDELNDRYGAEGRGQPFYLFHRERLWNAQESKWMGWERKRGKLVEFGRWLLGTGPTSYVVHRGDLSLLNAFRIGTNAPLIITLDADTMLPRGVARQMIGAMVHPLNYPHLCSDGEPRITRGYCILQPRISVAMQGTPRSRYHRTYASTPGIDPYASAASDVYQDLFGEGSFTGKGIYCLKTFECVLNGRFPENRILSHDLIEGCHGRVALTSDIEVFDSYPHRYDVDSRRQHRWVRGDWQIAAWLLSRVPSEKESVGNPLSLLSRWKIADNLRRSLYPISLILLLFTGWYFGATKATLVTSLAIAVVFLPAALHALLSVRFPRSDLDERGRYRAYARDVLRVFEGCLYFAAFLPHRAYLMADAIVRTWYRLGVTRARLLEWETAADTEARLANQAWATARQLSCCFVVGLAAFALARPGNAWSLAPWAVLWCLAPVIGQAISLPEASSSRTLLPHDRRFLMEVLSSTWGYFERFVDPQTHPLPPDNFQDYPRPKIAFRTSPTNEGLFLTSATVARWFGLLSTERLVAYLRQNLEAWFRLETMQGHHYNWYDTQTGTILKPAYVSTVDSGNLLASYLTVSQALKLLRDAPLISSRHLESALASLDWIRRVTSGDVACRTAKGQEIEACRGLRITLDRLQQHLPATLKTLRGVLMFQRWLKEASDELGHHAVEIASQENTQDMVSVLHLVVQRFATLDSELTQLVPWLPAFVETRSSADVNQDSRAGQEPHPDQLTLRQIVAWSHEGAHGEGTSWISGVDAALVTRGAEHAQRLLQQMEEVAKICDDAAAAMDFRFLYDEARKLFSIGYNAHVGSLDRSSYDMLISECRLTSYLAIAKSDVKPEHWFHLGRQATEIQGRSLLLSWGGTMFEYLMPPLFQRHYHGSLLHESCANAVEAQMQYGLRRGTPWGISESAYGAMASNSDYQYKSFGVPGLGLKRGLSKDHVVSPYSSALALMFEPVAAVKNLQSLAPEILSIWGFYDALDFTPSRLRARETSRPVRNYMSHHQGMTILAIANVVDDQVVQNWFHECPIVRASELLLQEKVPRVITVDEPNRDEIQDATPVREEELVVSRRIIGHRSATPKTLRLSNGHASSLCTHTGGGCFQFENVQITRWRPDTTRDHWGTSFYLKDRDSGQMWSAAFQPTRIEPDEYDVTFSIDKAEIRRRQGDLETLLEVVVSPEHNAEVRQLRITNHGTTARTIEVTSFCELAMTESRADIAHPAFHKLFIETEFLAEDATLVARRRRRQERDRELLATHTLAAAPDILETLQFDTSRETFLGRGRTSENPRALEHDTLRGSVGAVLDPCFALRCIVQLQPGEVKTIGFTTAVAESRDEALMVADAYRDMRTVQRAFELAWAYSQVEMRHLNVTAQQIHAFQRLGGVLLYPDRSLRADLAYSGEVREGQSALWRFGISGDLPLLLVRIASDQELSLVREVLEAYRFLTMRGMSFEVAFCNDYPGTYFDELQRSIEKLVEDAMAPMNQPRRAFTLRGAQMTREDHRLLDRVAAVLLRGDQGTLTTQLNLANSMQSIPPAGPTRTFVGRRSDGLVQPTSTLLTAAPIDPPADQDQTAWFDNEHGRFTSDGYEIELDDQHMTPTPWTNVIANPTFGCLVTESGGGYTWWQNSRENKLTSWNNDPVTDAPSEILYLCDLATAQVWSPVNLLSSTKRRRVEHRPGESIFEVTENALHSTTTIFVDTKLPVKLWHLKLRNLESKSRRLRLTLYIETVLGVSREGTLLHQTSERLSENAVAMRNAYHPDWPDQVAFLATRGQAARLVRFSGDRTAVLGRDGSWLAPLAASRELQETIGTGLDPCLAVQLDLELAAGAVTELELALGVADNRVAAEELLHQLSEPAYGDEAIQQVRTEWQEILGALTVTTPHPAFDQLVNRWLIYQTVSCRLWGRSALYQSGGAYGFRDQLQDVMALVYTRPDLAREQILRAASRQYEEGDVQHWWHPPGGKGTRTKFSDDFLFLPYCVHHYCAVTGDLEILDCEVPFITSLVLRADEHERYEQPQVTEGTATLLEHCRRALQHGMRYGRHGLPLMGCGDWNDGMNQVGAGGEGESVWVGWFQVVVFDAFASLIESRNPADEWIHELRGHVYRLRRALDEYAWDGAWYRRAFFDDGTPLGSSRDAECQIDSLAQSWAVVANGATPRAEKAFHSAIDRLFDRTNQMVLLFTPPFDKPSHDPGYIRGYVPGVRENGGQYTHAAAWMILAATQLREGSLAMELFDAVNPINHTLSREAVERYRTEPYAVAADVYSCEGHIGRGGWTWYTGSAAWLYRVAIENILGLKLQDDVLTIDPCVPDEWKEFTVKYARPGATWTITVELDDHSSTTSPPTIPLDSPGDHHVHVRCTSRRATGERARSIHLDEGQMDPSVDHQLAPSRQEWNLPSTN